MIKYIKTVLMFFVFISFAVGCSNQTPWIKFAFKYESFTLQKSDVEMAGKTKDAKGNDVVVFVLSDKAQNKLSAITSKYVDTEVDLYYKNEIIYKSLPIREGVKMTEIHIAVGSQDKADEMVKSWKDK